MEIGVQHLQTLVSSLSLSLRHVFLIPLVIIAHSFQIAQNIHIFKITLKIFPCIVVSFSSISEFLGATDVSLKKYLFLACYLLYHVLDTMNNER